MKSVHKSVHKALKLRHHKHTGKILAHKHTSYRVLFLLLLAPIMMMSLVGQLDAMADNLFVSATVPAPIPGGAPTIDSPADGTVTDDQQINVSGTCPVITPAIIVAIYENNILAGSVQCDVSGNYTLPISLVGGNNTLIATVKTITGDTGDSSTPVHVTRHVPTPPPSPSPSTSPGSAGTGGTSLGQTSIEGLALPLIIDAKDIVVTFGANGHIEWHGAASGGTAPYIFSIQWGDGQVEQRNVTDTSNQVFSHSYSSLHTYNIDITLTDAKGEKTTLRSAAVPLVVQTAPVVADTKPEQVHPIVAFVQKYSVQIYVGTVSALVFLWYLESGRHVLSIGKLIGLIFHH